MSNSYLDKFRSSLPTAQGNQILKLLISKKDSGEIRTVDEFKNRLKDLTAEILAERITPTLKLFKAIAGADTSSQQYNEMMERIHDDLEAGFAEANNLDEIITAHHNLIHEVALKALRFGVNELESKVSLYEFLNKSGAGFDDALFNTFRESVMLDTTRSDSAAELVFVDPMSGASVDTEEDTSIDFVGERLLMGTSVEKYLTPAAAVWLSNPNSIRSELDVEFKDSNIANIIDNTKNTFWVVPLLASSVRLSGVPLEVALEFGAKQDINFVEIEPVSDFPLTLVGIDYYDANNERLSTEVVQTLLKGITRINFARISTHALILRFRQYNYKEIQFTKKIGESNFHRAVLGESSNSVDLDSVSEDLEQMLTSDFILSDIMNVSSRSSEQLKYYQYLIGFDNIRPGFSTYNDRAIYSSKKKRVSQPGQVSVRVTEVRPLQDTGDRVATLETYTYSNDTGESTKFHHGVLEYWLVMQSFTKDDFLIATDTIPLLPLGAKRIHHERLYFSDSTSGAVNPNAGQLRFFTQDNGADVVLYKNGDPLVYTVDWEFVTVADPDVSHLTVISSNSGSPMKRGVKITDTVSPLDIYTVSYTPKLSNTKTIPADTTLLEVIDMIGDESARITKDNVIVFDSQKSSYLVDYADMYLVVLMRRNSAQENFSPALEDYMLITGSMDTSKFSGD